VPDDFGRYGIHRLEDFMASWSLDTDGARALAAGHPPNTDDHNRLATTRLPPAVVDAARVDFEDRLAEFDPLTPERLMAVDAVAVLHRMSWNGEEARATRLAATLPPAVTRTALGWIALDSGLRDRARALFREARALQPRLASARAGSIAVFDGDDLEPGSLSPEERATLEATRLVESSDWEGVHRLETALARIPPGALLYPTAARARVQWRLHTGKPARSREALPIIDALLTRQRTPMHMLLRASAAAIAGERRMARAALETLVGPGTPPYIRAQALALAHRLGPETERLPRLDEPGSQQATPAGLERGLGEPIDGRPGAEAGPKSGSTPTSMPTPSS
jgi:hypothetical protein